MTTPDIAGQLRSAAAYSQIGPFAAVVLIKHLTGAADTLERQAAEIERLREALAFYADRKLYRGNDTRWTAAGDDEGRKARAALTGEDA